MHLKKMEFGPPPQASDGSGNAHLELLTKRLEVSLANIDDKLERLLRASCGQGGVGGAASQEAFDYGDRQPISHGQAAVPSKLREGWLAVQASGGASPRTWEQDWELNFTSDSNSEKITNDSEARVVVGFEKSTEQHKASPEDVAHHASVNVSSQSSYASLTTSPASVDQPRASAASQQAGVPVYRNWSTTSTESVSVRIMNFISTKTRSSTRFSGQIWNAFQDPGLRTCSYRYELFVRFVILLSVTTTLLQTLPDFPMNQTTSAILEASFELFFLGEVFVRFMVSPNCKIFWCSTYNWIDLVSGAFVLLRASLGFTITEANSSDIRCSILIGFCPVIRILKLLRRMHQVHLLYKAFILAYQALQPLLSMYFFLLLVFTGMVWVVEPRSNIASFPAAAWFTFVSMTTMGYGDVTPDTAAGAVVVGFGTLTAMLYMAIPLGIIGSAFNDVWKDRDKILTLERTRDRLIKAGYKPTDLPKLFEIFDLNQDGHLDREEFDWLTHGLKLGLSRSSREELFKAVDQDGGVTHQQFVSSLFPGSMGEVYGKQVSSDSASSVNTETIQQEIDRRKQQSNPAGGQRRSGRSSKQDQI